MAVGAAMRQARKAWHVHELVKQARKGDLEAFGRLVERFQAAVYGAAYALLGDSHEAQDAAQEAFVRAWLKLKGLREPSSFPGWLGRIVRNHCVDRLRAARPQAVPLEGTGESALSPDKEPSERLEDRERRDAVLAAVRSLSEPNRLATTLFYVDGYSVQEVADFLAVPQGTIKRRLHESRRQIKERMVAMVRDWNW